ncbi:MAG: PIN domain-containing protein [Candidatus Methanospirare jalkutatii]|nr:PIN domain-containing protein [Candidatus Methanospirare jalkutatii]
MTFLVDTNIFLEILLGQDKKEECKKFLEDNVGDFVITDFTLHSIGVILFRYGKEDVFEEFVEDVVTNSEVLSLPVERYSEVVFARKNLNLDFDDAYQYAVAKHYRLKIVTMDRDFGRVTDVEVIFI